MFRRSNVHMHNNRSSSKCSQDSLYSGMYELYTICNATIWPIQSAGHLHSACANVYYCL